MFFLLFTELDQRLSPGEISRVQPFVVVGGRCTSGGVMYLVFTRMPGESHRRRLRSLLLYLCDVFRALINSLVCWFYCSCYFMFNVFAQPVHENRH